MADEEQDVTQAPDSSTGAPSGAETVDSPTTEGAAAQGSPAAEPASAKAEADPAKTERAQLIAELTGAVKEPEVAGDEAETEEGEETEVEGDEPEAKGDEANAASAAPETKKSDAPAKPGEQAALSEEELTAPVDARVAPKTKRRIEQLLEERKNSKPLADYGRSLLELQKAAGIPPEAFGAWVALGIDVNAKPENAPLRLYAEAKKLAAHQGITLPLDGPAPASLPADFDDFLIEQAEQGEISSAALKQLRERLKPLRTGAAPKPAAPPAQQTAAQPPVQTPAPQQRPSSPSPAIIAANEKITALEADYAKRYPADWAKIRPIVKAKMPRYNGTDPTQWADFFEREVKDAIASVVKPKPKVAPTTLRPAGATTQKPAENSRASIVAELTGRKQS